MHSEAGVRGLSDPLVEGDEAVGELVALGELADGVDRGATISCAIEMAGIVEHYVGSRPGALGTIDGANEMAGDGIRGGIAPIGGHCIPEYGGHTQFARDA